MSTRKLYLLRIKGEVGWDEYDAFLIRAETALEARHIAANTGGSETWLNASNSTCREVKGSFGDKGIIISSFNAG